MIGAFLSSTALILPGVQAQAGDLPVKAPVAEPVPYWWFHGEVEAGGRFFLNNPQRNGSAYLGQTSLAKYYEYSSIKPGPFSNIWLSTGSSDGLYRIDVLGKNIGYSDQRYDLDASKAGQHYFNFQWDQTPHVYSTSAQTPYLGVGTNALTLPPGSILNTGIMTAARLNPFLYQTDIGIQRDTASADYRWTPSEAWDIKADYSHLSRTGTQVDGVVGISGRTGDGGGTQVPRPVKDSTQNYGLNGEYADTTPWGKITYKAGYQGSQYTDDYQSYTIQNAYCVDAACTGILNNESQFSRMSLWPSNQANALTGTLAADLPFKSRYVGTASYTMMRQNSNFQPMSTAAAFTLPAASLNGAINTTLINNTITTKITSELNSKLSYRYYDYQNDTPQERFVSWISQDRTTGSENTIQSLLAAYKKQNLAAQLNWRPTREWNLNAEYGYERYDYGQTAADVDTTNEHSGKLSADWKPMSWATLRTSGYFSDRRFDNYNHIAVANIQWPGLALPSGDTYLANQRQFMIDNRQRTKANVAFDIVVLPGVTISPNYKFQDDNYRLNPNAELGLTSSRIQSGGVDVGYMANHDLSFVFSYLREHYDQSIYGYSSAGSVFGAANRFPVDISAKDTVDTFTVATKYAAIPNKLDLDLRYAMSRAVDESVNIIPPATNGGTPQSTTPAGGQWTPVTTWFQRLDATATYKFDPVTVAQMGWKGDVKAKLRYTWERNSDSNWQNDSLAPYSQLTAGQSAIWLAGDNPNYNVHMLAVSLLASW
jgi:MtrB/PioB family decaheme-associated outer membrane protein